MKPNNRYAFYSRYELSLPKTKTIYSKHQQWSEQKLYQNYIRKIMAFDLNFLTCVCKFSNKLVSFVLSLKITFDFLSLNRFENSCLRDNLNVFGIFVAQINLR